MLQSQNNLIAAANTPILVRGGASSSDILNRANQRMLQDLLQLSANVRSLTRTQQQLSALLAMQAIGMQGLVGHLQTLMPAVSGTHGLADFYGLQYVAAGNTANIDTDFGQATLPILSVQEKMSTTDALGNVYVPDDARLQSFLTDSVSDAPAGISAYQNSVEDYLGIGAQPNTFYMGAQPTAGEQVLYLRATIPQTLSANTLANRVTFYPVPAFQHTLLGVNLALTDGTAQALDISYLPGYDGTLNGGAGGVPYLGPTRLHFPQPAEITAVIVILQVDGYWGMQQFGVQLVEYGPSATLQLDFSSYDPNPFTVVIPYGKDPSILSQYPQTIATPQVGISLVQSQIYTSPILTSVEARW
jgi:hypothetical protein